MAKGWTAKAIAKFKNGKLEVYNDVIRDICEMPSVKSKKLIVVNFVGKTSSSKIPITMFWNYCSDRNIRERRGQINPFSIDRSEITMWKPFEMNKNMSVILMRTPYIDKASFIEAFTLSSIFASVQGICTQKDPDDVECLKTCLDVEKKLGLNNHFFMSSSGISYSRKKDDDEAGQLLGINALNNLIRTVPCEEDQLKIRRAFKHSRCFFTYYREKFYTGQKMFIGAVLRQYKEYAGCILTGAKLLLHYHGLLGIAPQEKPKASWNFGRDVAFYVLEIVLLVPLIIVEICSFVNLEPYSLRCSGLVYSFFLLAKAVYRLVKLVR